MIIRITEATLTYAEEMIERAIEAGVYGPNPLAVLITALPFDNTPDAVQERLLWGYENCRGKWTMLTLRWWLFETEADAIHFDMRWS